MGLRLCQLDKVQGKVCIGSKTELSTLPAASEKAAQRSPAASVVSSLGDDRRFQDTNHQRISEDLLHNLQNYHNILQLYVICTRTRLNSHHGAAVTSRVAGATKISSHITTLKSHHGHHFLKEIIAGANESSKSCLHSFSIRIKKSLRTRSPYAMFN